MIYEESPPPHTHTSLGACEKLSDEINKIKIEI